MINKLNLFVFLIIFGSCNNSTSTNETYTVLFMGKNSKLEKINLLDFPSVSLSNNRIDAIELDDHQLKRIKKIDRQIRNLRIQYLSLIHI